MAKPAEDEMMAKWDAEELRLYRLRPDAPRDLEDDALEEHRRHQLTLQALRDIDEGVAFSQEQVEAWVAERRRKRGAATQADWTNAKCGLISSAPCSCIAALSRNGLTEEAPALGCQFGHFVGQAR